MPHYWFEFAVLNRGGVDAHLQLPRLDETGALTDDSVSEAWIAGLEDIRLLYERGFFAENTLTAGDAETVAMFGDGEAAFLLDGSWKVGFFSENYADRLDDFAVCCVPAQSGRQPSETVGGISTGYFITRKAWDDPEKREAAVTFVSQLTSDAVIGQFVTTETTALASPIVPAGGNSLYQSAARMNAAVTEYVGAVQDALSGEARSSLFSNIPNIVTGRITAHDAVEQAMRLN